MVSAGDVCVLKTKLSILGIAPLLVLELRSLIPLSEVIQCPYHQIKSKRWFIVDALRELIDY